MHRAHGAVVPLAHGHQHGECLSTTYFTHDDSVGVHSECHASEIGKRHFTLTFDVGATTLQRVIVGMFLREVLQTKFVCIFNRDDAFNCWDFIQQGPQQCGFP